MKKTMKTVSLLVALLLILSFALTGCGGSDEPAAPEEEGTEVETVVLKLYSAWPENNTNLVDMDKFIQKVSEKTDGTVVIEWGGGPEAIPSYQLVEAIKNGVVDIAWTAHTYNVSHIPVLEGMKLTDAATMRENGGFEYVDQLYMDKLNAVYLGNFTYGLSYNLYTNKEIKALSDFEGLTMRATPAYQDFVASLGAGVTNMAPTEAYQALERNVIQGFGWPSIGIMDFGWQEVTKYVIEPSFYTVDVCAIVGGPAWEKLNDDQKAALYEAGLEVETEAADYYKDIVVDEHAKLEEAGMTIITLPDDIAATYKAMALEEGWKAVEKNAPDDFADLKQFVTE